jgi:hypothetical protein
MRGGHRGRDSGEHFVHPDTFAFRALATADRREEAKGKLQELDASDPQPLVDDAEAVDQAELDVRNDHGDLAPSAERDARPATVPPKGG